MPLKASTPPSSVPTISPNAVEIFTSCIEGAASRAGDVERAVPCESRSARASQPGPENFFYIRVALTCVSCLNNHFPKHADATRIVVIRQRMSGDIILVRRKSARRVQIASLRQIRRGGNTSVTACIRRSRRSCGDLRTPPRSSRASKPHATLNRAYMTRSADTCGREYCGPAR